MAFVGAALGAKAALATCVGDAFAGVGAAAAGVVVATGAAEGSGTTAGAEP
jgi:hypothetical protein